MFTGSASPFNDTVEMTRHIATIVKWGRTPREHEPFMKEIVLG